MFPKHYDEKIEKSLKEKEEKDKKDKTTGSSKTTTQINLSLIINIINLFRRL